MAIGRLAATAGARTVGVVSTQEKVDVAAGYGFEEVFTNDELKAGAVSASSVDVVLDSVGGTLRGSCWRMLAPFGMLIAYGNASGEPEKPIAPRDLRARNQRAGGFSINALARMQPRLLSQLVQEAIATVAEGQLQIDISLVLPLDQAADAHRAVETRRSTGKVALTLDAA